MPLIKRRHALTCSTRCRVARLRALALPIELTGRRRWVRYSDRKVPLTIAGVAASSTDPATWCSYQRAKASKVGVGIGFVLNGDGIVCLDLDHCIVDGRLSAPAERLLAAVPDTYIEISPSGAGLHVWGYGRLERGRRTVVEGQALEAYGTGRYITVTGKRWSSSTARFANLSGVLATL
jgi:primase-polymerase (primpol)-like protein